jgi:tRNA threonylcarbamoyladenosine modification (KEOPS) complex Cgi121 subunit
MYSLARALRSFEMKQNISRNINIEILLIISGSRDINKAVQNLGPRVGDPAMLTIINCEKTFLHPDLEFKEIKPVDIGLERLLENLENLSKTLKISTVLCNEKKDLGERILCIEKSIINKISLLRD